MNAGHVVAIRTQYPVRPGRRAIVAVDLADLRGPAHGTVTLPLGLFWSSPDREWDLDDPIMLRSMYEKVLREAVRADDLTTHLNGGKLTEVWPQLYLPEGVRRAWEEHHPAQRVAGRRRLMDLRPRATA
jgi:hypothetical protein